MLIPPLPVRRFLMTFVGVGSPVLAPGTRPLAAPQLSHSPHPLYSHILRTFYSWRKNGRRSTWLLFTQANRPYSWSVVHAWLLFTQANRPYSWSVVYGLVYEPFNSSSTCDCESGLAFPPALLSVLQPRIILRVCLSPPYPCRK